MNFGRFLGNNENIRILPQKNKNNNSWCIPEWRHYRHTLSDPVLAQVLIYARRFLPKFNLNNLIRMKHSLFAMICRICFIFPQSRLCLAARDHTRWSMSESAFSSQSEKSRRFMKQLSTCTKGRYYREREREGVEWWFTHPIQNFCWQYFKIFKS